MQIEDRRDGLDPHLGEPRRGDEQRDDRERRQDEVERWPPAPSRVTDRWPYR